MNPAAVLRLIGLILLMLGASMLLSVIVALYYSDGDAYSLLLSALIIMAVGTVSALIFRNAADLSARDGFSVVTFGWLFMSLAGALPFLISDSIPSVTDAFFESASGFTTTGASILTNIEALPHGILFWRSFTHWIGGMGIIVFSIAILPFLGVGGMQMFKAESPGPTADKLTPRIRNTAEILWGVYVLLTLLEIILLRVGGMRWFDSTCHAFGTMATGGFSTKNASIGYYQSPYIHYVITFFMFVAGASFTLHYHALRGNLRKYWQSPEFKFFSVVIGAGILIVTAERLVANQPIELAFRQAAFQVVSITTTTGYATSNFEEWRFVAQVLLVGMMLMGGMAGSTGGGIKAVRVQILLKQARMELHKIIHPNTIYPIRLGRKVLQGDIVQNVLAFFLLYALLVLLGTMVMALLGLDPVSAMTSTIACLSNIGPGLGDVGPADNYSSIPLFGKWVLAVLMIVGRLEIFTVLVLTTRTYWTR
ncbi:TrkH family potassium uptake protein [bacterium]|nr:TrkH family potassium uptake protein [bacterium]